MALQFAGFFALVSINVPILCLFIGSCWILTSIAQDIPMDLTFLTMTSGDTCSNISRVAIHQRFFAAIQCFSDVKQLSLNIFTSPFILMTLQFIDSLFC